MKTIPPLHTAFLAFFVSAGCLAAPTAAADLPDPPSFHHIHLNVTDRDAAVEFYSRIFGAVPIQYHDRVPALFTERSFILLEPVDSPPPSALTSGIWHMGWGGVDMPNEYEWLKAQGVKIHTPLYPLGRIHVTYVQGPDDELIEVNTMGHHRFAHVHLFAKDVNATTDWYRDHLGLQPRREHVPKPDLTKERAWSNGFRCDNISFIVYGRPDYTPPPPWWPHPPLTKFDSTEGRPIDHVAFSYRDIDPVFERMKAEGVTIVQPIRTDPDYGHRSFFVQGPDKVLIEIVEAKPIPDSSWE